MAPPLPSPLGCSCSPPAPGRPLPADSLRCTAAKARRTDRLLRLLLLLLLLPSAGLPTSPASRSSALCLDASNLESAGELRATCRSAAAASGGGPPSGIALG